MNCVFCEIVKNNIPSYTIYEDKFVKAFLDINPDCNGHTLIIPKKHYIDITDIDNETISHIMNASRKIKKLLKERLNIDGLTFIQNNGAVQEVKHYHLHLKPFYKNKTELTDVEKVYHMLTD